MSAPTSGRILFVDRLGRPLAVRVGDVAQVPLDAALVGDVRRSGGVESQGQGTRCGPFDIIDRVESPIAATVLGEADQEVGPAVVGDVDGSAGIDSQGRIEAGPSLCIDGIESPIAATVRGEVARFAIRE
ncbi:MAG: hypothetical protein HYY06_08330 [Deltaproteobacteria bacterium]|nr:hypothetical protein [Deltaproteobacteria bacterium]